MARIDPFIQAFARFGAQGAIMASDEKVTLKFPQGNRFASQSTPHAALVAMVEEVAPKGTSLKSPTQATFAYALDGKSYDLKVEAAHADSWTVTITPKLDAPAEPAPRGADRKSQRRIEVPERGKPAAPEPATPIGRIRAAAPAAGASASPATVVETPKRATASTEAAPGTGSGHAIDRLLTRMVHLGASDLHLTTGAPPMVRLHGEMSAVPGQSPLDAAELWRLLLDITPAKNRTEFEESNDSDFAYALPGISRFRVNVFRDRNGPGAVFRSIPFEILSADKLGLPKRVLELCDLTKGLVLVTGPTGSGKSTTLAALIDHVNRTRADHIITIEDPVEFVHENKRCLVNQREVHTHTRSFKDALRAALREDPDIVLVGEMRDLETIEIAVETAETGHLVFGTLHTTTAPSTVDRIIDQFPADRQEQIRQMLAESLRGVIAQSLCRKVGGGRVAAYEILIGTPAVANLIRERKTFQLFSVMQTGKNLGMLTLNDSLYDLVKRGVVDPREAYLKAVSKAELKGMLQRDGLGMGLGETAS
jgi:twitching motility protein PilT